MARKLKLLAGLSPKIAACLNSQSNRGRLKKAPETNPATGKKDMVWFALNDDRSLFAFAGIWTEFRGDRGTKSKPIPGSHLVYGFLTTAANAVVETDTP